MVVGRRDDSIEHAPNTREAVDAERLAETTNLIDAEDSLRYLPSLLVRKRHVGDSQAPLATRTSGVGASARSLIYADGVLLSALIGNNNSFASPRWGMVSPDEIARVEVLYGPFSAAYPGNSIGAVVNIVTRLPERLEASVSSDVNLQAFDHYGRTGLFPAYRVAANVGDRIGPLSWFASASHLDSRGQPLAYVTALQPAAPQAGGTPVTGAVSDLDRSGRPIFALGAGGLERQRQDNLKFKLSAELGPSLRLTYSVGLFLNDTDSRAETYLSGPSGPIFAGTLNIDGRRVTVPASAFSNQVYAIDQRHWMHALSLDGAGETFSWSAIATLYDFGRDVQRIPSGALPASAEGGAGSIVRMDGTGWRTLDLKARWHASAGTELSFGAHEDRFELANHRYATADWRSGEAGALVQAASGRTRTSALWLQDGWHLSPQLELTLGARYEWWRAYRGFNFSSSPALAVDQPARSSAGLSPKASLHWSPGARWAATFSLARALRFPTVSELYQAIATGPTITVPNPDLRPERATSAELALERSWASGHVRLSLFRERIEDALLSQTAPLLPGSTALFTYVQNVGAVRTNGLELAFERRGLLPGFDLSGSVTLADPEIVSDPAFPAAEGKTIPQVPRRRASLVATWRPTDIAALSLAGRYASRSFATIDNSDTVGHTYQGFESYLVLDARALIRIAPHWELALGVENLGDRRYFLFHPFPGRTFTAEATWRW
ncbi:MAG: TonB-dependent receptor [Alphaproteobacteria bacterium]|nr:MAG: TonB-dependent receptor [Alphaproteobacteria bacterium]